MFDTRSAPVDGGELFVATCGPPGAPVVLALHGITGNHLHLAFVARELAADHHVVTPDLRGRGQSAGISGPFGIGTHAADLVAVLDDLDAARAIVVGHSMGAFVAVRLAADRPDRVERVVLVDGGLPLDDGVGPDESIDETLDRVIGPAVARLSMTFPSVEAYRDFWKAHPAIGDDWSNVLEAAVDYDLVGTAPHLRSGVALAAVRADGADNVDDAKVLAAADATSCPIDLVWAERGMRGEPPGLYTEDRVAAFRTRFGDRFRDRRVDGVNHYTIVLTARGAARVAEVVRDGRA